MRCCMWILPSGVRLSSDLLFLICSRHAWRRANTKTHVCGKIHVQSTEVDLSDRRPQRWQVTCLHCNQSISSSCFSFAALAVATPSWRFIGIRSNEKIKRGCEGWKGDCWIAPFKARELQRARAARRNWKSTLWWRRARQLDEAKRAQLAVALGSSTGWLKKNLWPPLLPKRDPALKGSRPWPRANTRNQTMEPVLEEFGGCIST